MGIASYYTMHRYFNLAVVSILDIQYLYIQKLPGVPSILEIYRNAQILDMCLKDAQGIFMEYGAMVFFCLINGVIFKRLRLTILSYKWLNYRKLFVSTRFFTFPP